jgi:transketolase
MSMTSNAIAPAAESFDWSDLDDRAVATIRSLVADIVENARGGHPGTAISMAAAAHLLFSRVMNHDPSNPEWLGRDRFVLSMGHSSLTLYIQLFLTGYPMTLEDLKATRTLHSKTPGHPELDRANGIEMTTGPLGEGVASAVGMAMAARRERGLFDPGAPEGESPFDHTIWVFAGDGCMQEGVAMEAAALAGHLQLGNLVLLWDDNRISADDDTVIAVSEDTLAKFAAMGWPAPTKQNTGAIHGAPMGAQEVAGMKRAIGFDPEKTFVIEEAVLGHTRRAAACGRQRHADWTRAMERWRSRQPEHAALLSRLEAGALPDGWLDALPDFEPGETLSTRKASGRILNAIAPLMPELWGGAADLDESTYASVRGEAVFAPAVHSTKAYGDVALYGRNIHYGVREHGMAAPSSAEAGRSARFRRWRPNASGPSGC